MNREQYLAKRMWFHGPQASAGHCGTAWRQPESAACTVSPPASLADYYQRFHQRDEPEPRLEDPAH